MSRRPGEANPAVLEKARPGPMPSLPSILGDAGPCGGWSGQETYVPSCDKCHSRSRNEVIAEEDTGKMLVLL